MTENEAAPVTVVIAGEPVAKARPRLTRRQRAGGVIRLTPINQRLAGAGKENAGRVGNATGKRNMTNAVNIRTCT